jgi:ribulose-phosphate 3-epimerase
MEKNIKISPSLLSADFSRLGEEVKAVTKAGADFIHLDIMDGHFVPNITFGPMVLKAVRGCSPLPFESHLMIERPDVYWRNFVEAGADVIGIHIECSIDHKTVIKDIQDAGKKVCMVLNPPTDVEKIYPFLDSVEQVLVMTVNPGFGGQAFIKETVPKIEKIADIRERRNLMYDISVDGGINYETAKMVKDAGANILIAGSFIFGRKGGYREVIEGLR